MNKYLLTLSFFLLVTGCIVQTERPRLEYGNNAEYANWKTLDAGGFTIQAPSNWEFIPELGIDSTVGKFSNGEMTLTFDYGMYTGDFTNNSVYFEDPSAYTVTEEIIGGLQAKLFVPKEANAGKSTVLFIKNPRGLGPCTEGVCGLSQDNFEMLGDNLSAEQVTLAIQIFRTVHFYKA